MLAQGADPDEQPGHALIHAGRPKRPLALAALAALALAGAAQAQPLILPGARLPGPDGASPLPAAPGAATPGAPGQPGSPGAPPAPRPAAAKAVSEESVVGRDLRLNGQEGSIRLERSGRGGGLRARVVFQGTMISRPSEACAVKLDAGEPVDLAAQGRPEGLARYELQAPACPIVIELLDGAVWVRGPEAACQLQAADCRVDPRGLWGPEPAALLPQARAFESDRGQADRAVRENYKALTSRAKPGEARGVVAEQAAFSAERETLCRSYAREAAHGFCHARFAEARAASLAARLGVTAPAAQPARRPRPPADPAAGLSPRPGPPPSPGSPAFGSDPSGIR